MVLCTESIMGKIVTAIIIVYVLYHVSVCNVIALNALTELSKRFRVAGDAKKEGDPTKHKLNTSYPDHCLDHSHLVFHRIYSF